jgi:NADP-dependent 3-hydroxy acid dehydrogenase YdfG
MEVAGGGVIVNIASSAGKKGYVRQGAYTAAKHGVMGLSKVLAMELQQQGIHVHAVCPGGVATRMSEEIHTDRDQSQWMQPEDIAEVVRFLVTRPSHLTIDEVVVRRFASSVMF